MAVLYGSWACHVLYGRCRFMVGVCDGGCPGVPVSCVRVWDSPRVSGMPCRDHPGVCAVVAGYVKREGARCGVPSL